MNQLQGLPKRIRKNKVQYRDSLGWFSLYYTQRIPSTPLIPLDTVFRLSSFDTAIIPNHHKIYKVDDLWYSVFIRDSIHYLFKLDPQPKKVFHGSQNIGMSKRKYLKPWSIEYAATPGGRWTTIRFQRRLLFPKGEQ